jgi:hypothetical protein
VPHRVRPVAEAIQVGLCSAHRRGQAAADEASHRSRQLVPVKPAGQVRAARTPVDRYQPESAMAGAYGDTLNPAHDRRVAESSRNYRFWANAQLIAEAGTGPHDLGPHPLTTLPR